MKRIGKNYFCFFNKSKKIIWCCVYYIYNIIRGLILLKCALAYTYYL